MNTQTIPTQTKSPIQVFHTIIIDGSEVEVTRFYEFMKNKWNKILNELSYRVSTGIPDLSNEQHLMKLWFR